MSERKTTSSGAKSTGSSRTAKTGAGASRKKSTGTAAGTKKKSAGKKAQTAAERQKRLLHRTVRACVYLFLAFLGVLSIFNVQGFLIDWYKALFAALFGFGYYLTPLIFLCASVLLIARMKYKVRAREAALFCIPLFFGAMGHMVRDISAYPAGLEGLKQLCVTGRALTSGGLISGLLGRFLKAALSAGGGIFLCLLAIAGCGFIAAGTNPVTFIKKLRPAPEEPDEDEPAKKPAAKPAPAPAPAAGTLGFDEDLPFDLTPKKRPAADQPAVTTVELQPGKKRAGARGGFVDFFRKDKPEPARQPEANPVRRDPTAPPEPSFTTIDTALNGSFEPLDAVMAKNPPVAGTFGSDTAAPDKPAAAETAPAAPEDDAGMPPPFDFDKLTAAPRTPAQTDSPASRPQAPADAGFDIYTADNPPPAEMSLDEKRQAAGEAHEKAAEENQASLAAAPEKAEAGQYIYPPLSLLTPGDPSIGADHESIVRCADRLIDTLRSFNIEAAIVNVTKGPTITRYELQLQRGIKFSKVTSLSDDIALALGAVSVRIAPIPSNNSVGIEVPNDIQEVVSLRDVLQSKAFTGAKSKISFAVGKDIAGQCVVGDISKMPHMLIAGTTGSGKSVCINSILISLIYKASPEEVRLILVDPKMIELGMYNGIPHLLIPVVTDPKKAAGALNWAVGEMMRRYKLLAEYNVRSLDAYNEEVRRRGEDKTLPQIVIIIDELADLMMVAAKEVEESIARIAQMARAAGMHLIVATQRPSTDVITGLMKANIPSRISFAVASQIESRIILDQTGAEKLIGRGDMLYNPLGAGKPLRVQGTFISSPEVESVIDFVKNTSTAEYSQEILDHIERQAESKKEGTPGGDGEEADDPLLMDAISVVVDRGEASTSLLQRRLKLGYARAARLIDIMEERGIVGPYEGSKPRAVLLTRDQWSEMQLRMRG
ncbi:MAG: DNA translocase FtsK [Clostridia bacterium]|nr:DNA translocase FtsK [Clostridia bacterium]